MMTGSEPSVKTILIFLVTFLVFYLSRELRLESSSAVVSEAGSVLYLETRTDLDDLIRRLSDLEVRFDREELVWAASILGWRNFHAGRYEIEGSWSYDGLLSKVALGIQDHAAVIIHPGSSISRLSASLGRQLKADSSEFAAVFADSSSLVKELDYDPQSLFARMLPDTYNFYWTSEPASVVRRIYSEFESRVTGRLGDRIAGTPLDLDELITLASIIEWEARHDHEKSRVSGLYMNRLNRRMRLQADPTVIYALGEHRRLLYDDYLLDHPYNTYMIDGLPPGPITNPGMASLEAAIQPEEHDFLYMVASTDGGHTFTRTFEEHRLASSEWRRWIREQYRIRDERERAGEQEDGS